MVLACVSVFRVRVLGEREGRGGRREGGSGDRTRDMAYGIWDIRYHFSQLWPGQGEE